MNATYSPEDNKLRLYPETRLDTEDYNRVKAAGFIWAPKQQLFVAPAWTPSREDLLLEMCGDIEDEDKSLVDRAEERAERFEDYSDKRAIDYERAKNAVSAIADNIPLGQPILVGHHSEKHARKDAERIENGMRKAVKMWETSKYWERRAAGAIRAAKYKELPRVRVNRIKGLEADKRKQERNKAEAEAALKMWTHDGLTHEQAFFMAGRSYALNLPCVKSEYGYYEAWDVLRPDDERYSDCPAWTVEQVVEKAKETYPRRIAYAERWINHLNNRLLYEKAMLEEQGESDLLKPAPKPKQLPLCNYRAPEGVDVPNPYQRGQMEHLTQVEMTAEEYKKIYNDYKGTRIVDNSHRVRTALIRQPGKEYYHRDHVCIFITDSKVHDRPEPIAKKETLPPMPTVKAYIPPKEDPEAAQVQALRDSLKTGVQVAVAPSLFPTPPDVAERMVELAEIEPGHSVLEPSAGTGNLIKAMSNIRPNGTVTAVEINYSLCKLLEPLADEIVRADFLECNGDLGTFDRIVMNPPFDMGADIKHIEHALGMLKPGGVLVALCANGPRQRAAFIDRADYWEDLPEGTFRDQGTSVRSALMVLRV
jgi:protein-L-isoaspartate O-methyltransferase